MTGKTVLVLLAVFCLAPAGMAGGLDGTADAPALDLQVRPRLMRDPGTMRATAIVEPDERNRRVTLRAESSSYYHSSSRSLDGMYAARRFTRVFRDMSPGVYEVTAIVERNDGTSINRMEIVEVTGRRR